MLRWSLAFFLVALVAGVLGFTELASEATWTATVLFLLFLACLVAFSVFGLRRSRRRGAAHVRPRMGRARARTS